MRPYREDDKPSEPSSPQHRPNIAPGEPDDEFAPSPSPTKGGEGTPTPLNSLLDAEFAPGGRQHTEAISQ